MKIRVFDIRWRTERSSLPSVIEYDCVLETYPRKHPKRIGEPLRRLIHNSYLVTPVFFKYVLGNTKKIYAYEYTGVRHMLGSE